MEESHFTKIGSVLFRSIYMAVRRSVSNFQLMFYKPYVNWFEC